MNLLDLLVVLLAVAAGVGGYRVGFVARATAWVGLALGTLLASRLLPTIVEARSGDDGATLLLVVLVVLVAGATVGQLAGMVVGQRLRLAIPPGPARSVDQAGGAVAGVVGVAIALWLILPTMADTPGWPSEQARGSTLAGFVHDRFPEPPDTVRALRHLVGDDLFPRVLEGIGAAPDLGPPPPETGLDSATADRVAASTVQVETRACGRVRQGSGAVIGPDLVVTNAHVVAGSEGTSILRHPDGASLDATVVAFDPRRDVAILSVPGIDRPALPLDDGSTGAGAVGAVFGHPGGGPLLLQPFKIGRVQAAVGRDIYDAARTERQVEFLASHLLPGDSGGPLVDPRGVVLGVAFAIAPDDPNVAYALTIGEVTPVLAGAGPSAVDAGPCLN